TYKIPDPPEKSWYSRFMPKKKVELDAGIEQSAIVIKERDD
ncbi:type VI secretion system lipoprotein TssJ, partial [Escherichia coli]